jgi:hypothetical protein
VGKEAGATPQSPDYSKLIPQQEASNLRQYQTQLEGSRANQVGPTGSQTWGKASTFDDAGYQKALAEWQTGNSQGTWVPGSPATPGTGQGDGGYIEGTPASSGYWTGGSSSGTPSPEKSHFNHDQWTLTNTLSPEQQALYDAQTGAQVGAARGAQAAVGSPFSLDGLPEVQSSPLVNPSTGGAAGRIGGYEGKIGGHDPMSYYAKAADALYGQNTRYLDPQYQQQQSALESRLAEQGFVPGTPAYQQAMDQFSQGRERAYADARDRATSGGVVAGNSAFGNSLSGLQAQIAAALQGGGVERQGGLDANQVSEQLYDRSTGDRTRGLSELLTSRNQPINELAALLGKNPVGGSGSNPAQFSTPNLGGVDQIGAANADYSNQLGLYNAGVSSDNATKSAIASLLAAFVTKSDRRLKTEIQRVGTSRKGFPLYIFQYLASPGEWELGVMADEVPASMKFRHYDGFWRVDYSKVWA